MRHEIHDPAQPRRAYCERFDMYYDIWTGEYLESKCSDPDCEFCSKRPTVLATACFDCHLVLEDGEECEGMKRRRA